MWPYPADLEQRYRRFGEVEVGEDSPLLAAWAVEIASTPALLALVAGLPADRRQPNLVLAAARYLSPDRASFAEMVDGRWPEVRAVVLTHRTQTNEVGRCAVLLPLLAALSQPLALVEVGASAGLCLYPDRYSYRYDGRSPVHPADGPSPVELRCATRGPVPFPSQLPEVVWRAGIDLDPLDVRDRAAVDWLRALVWPGQDERVRRLEGAIRVARNDPAYLVRGDLNDRLTEVVAQAPAGATVVVFHSAVLAYLSVPERDRFVATVRGLPVTWVANEAPAVLGFDEGPARLFAVAVDGRQVGWAGGHGQTLAWL